MKTKELSGELVALGVDEDIVRSVRREAARLRSRPRWTIRPRYHAGFEGGWDEPLYIVIAACGDEALMAEAAAACEEGAPVDRRMRAETTAALAVWGLAELGVAPRAMSLLRRLALAAWTESRPQAS